VGCSLGRGAADELSDIDAALGVDAERGAVSDERLSAVEELVAAALPELGELVDVLRHPAKTDQRVRVIFAQYADGTQLDLAVVPEAEIQLRTRRGGAPDFIPLYQVSVPPDPKAVESGGQSSAEPVEDDGAANVGGPPGAAGLSALASQARREGLPAATDGALLVTEGTVTNIEQRNPAPPCA